MWDKWQRSSSSSVSSTSLSSSSSSQWQTKHVKTKGSIVPGSDSLMPWPESVISQFSSGIGKIPFYVHFNFIPTPPAQPMVGGGGRGCRGAVREVLFLAALFLRPKNYGDRVGVTQKRKVIQWLGTLGWCGVTNRLSLQGFGMGSSKWLFCLLRKLFAQNRQGRACNWLGGGLGFGRGGGYGHPSPLHPLPLPPPYPPTTHSAAREHAWHIAVRSH